MNHDKLRSTLDRALPTPAQEDAMLAGLLREDREDQTVKKLSRRAVSLLATAVLLAASAFAVAAGLDAKLIRFFGAAPEEAPLLSAAAVPLNVSDTDHGVTLRISQAIADRYSAMLLIEITAPEGTSLDAEVFTMDTSLNAVAADGERLGGWSLAWDLLEDEVPAGNRASLLLSLHSYDEGACLLGAALDFTFDGLYEGYGGSSFDAPQALSGQWRCRFTLPEEDPGRYVRLDAPIELDGGRVTLRSVYLSPITYGFQLAEGPDRLLGLDWMHGGDFWKDDVLNTTDGETVALANFYALGTAYRTETQLEDLGQYLFRPGRIIDPAEIEAVTVCGQRFALE